MSADRLEGVMRLTPALGQQKLYVLVFTTDKDLQQTTTLLDPAKAYAKGVGNAIPDIPDPIARHTTDGLLKLKVKTSSSSSVLVGPLFGSSGHWSCHGGQYRRASCDLCGSGSSRCGSSATTGEEK